MLSPTRRIQLYWALLIFPTLAVGAGAVYLILREQARMEERVGRIEESRRAALNTRARLAAENAELIITDLQVGLLETLGSAKSGDARADDEFLAELQRANPLVHATFRCNAEGGLLRPAANSVDAAERGFRRRFSAALRQAVAGGAPSAAPAPRKEEFSQNDYAANVQRARRDVQTLAKVKSSVAEKRQPASAPARRDEAKGAGLKDQPSLALAENASALESNLALAPVQVGKALEAGRSGWLPVTVERRLFVLGWASAGPSAPIRGVELEMNALVARLAAILPSDLMSGEGLCLRDERGRVLHQVGLLPGGKAEYGVSRQAQTEAAQPSLLASVPLNGALLPGWTVEAYLAPAGDVVLGGAGGFVLVASLLAGILVVAIFSGGLLLFRQARESAREALQKTSFVANVSHELKTPLTTIRLYADLLEQGRVADAVRRGEYLRTIAAESERLSRLVGNVLDFSRLERGLRKLAREDLDLSGEVRRVCSMDQERLAVAGLRLDLVLPDAEVRVCADRDALGQVLLNLLDNAVKYAADGGEVKVSLLEGRRGLALVRVLDRGPGVPAAERERIFLKFNRLDQSLTAEKGGAGLGLSIARQLARAMGGELCCKARDDGGSGAVFELSLPVAGAVDGDAGQKEKTV